MKHRKILVATALTETCKSAARWAIDFAKIADVEIAVTHDIEISVPNWLRGAYNVLEDTEQLARVEAKVQDWFVDATGREPDSVHVTVGHPYQQIADLAEELNVSMIVIARSSKTSLEKFLVGSTAQMLAVSPPAPVVIVPSKQGGLALHSRIGVASDLTGSSDKAIRTAALLAKMTESHLDIIHASVFQAPPSLQDEEIPSQLTPEALQQAAQEQMERVLHDHREYLAEIEHATHIIHAEPIRGIEQFVKENGLDLLVAGNADHYNLVTNLFGRVSVKLVQVADCTVMVVPPSMDAPMDDVQEEE